MPRSAADNILLRGQPESAMTRSPVSRNGEASERSVIASDAEKIAALAEFAAGAGHEINNPLATIVGRVQQLLRDESDPVRRAALHSIGAQAYRIRDMIGDVMLFARPPAPVRKLISVNAVAGEVIAKFRLDPLSHLTSVAAEFSASSEIFADPTQFASVLHELLKNAREALSPAGGEIRMTTRNIERDRRKFVELAVVDQGRGFTELEARHAFDPFFSGRQAGRGLGFGLCKCVRIAELNGANMEIDSTSTGPTTVRLIWPANEASANSSSG